MKMERIGLCAVADCLNLNVADGCVRYVGWKGMDERIVCCCRLGDVVASSASQLHWDAHGGPTRQNNSTLRDLISKTV